MLHSPPIIYLYDSPSTEGLDIREIGSFVQAVFPAATLVLRRDFIAFHSPSDPVPVNRARVWDLRWPGADSASLPWDTRLPASPRIVLDEPAVGPIYDALRLLAVLRDLLPRQEASLRHLHIVFIDELMGTFENEDRRFHARVIACGQPSVISATSLVEGPARPREYYFLR